MMSMADTLSLSLSNWAELLVSRLGAASDFCASRFLRGVGAVSGVWPQNLLACQSIARARARGFRLASRTGVA